MAALVLAGTVPASAADRSRNPRQVGAHLRSMLEPKSLVVIEGIDGPVRLPEAPASIADLAAQVAGPEYKFGLVREARRLADQLPTAAPPPPVLAPADAAVSAPTATVERTATPAPVTSLRRAPRDRRGRPIVAPRPHPSRMPTAETGTVAAAPSPDAPAEAAGSARIMPPRLSLAAREADNCRVAIWTAQAQAELAGWGSLPFAIADRARATCRAAVELAAAEARQASVATLTPESVPPEPEAATRAADDDRSPP